MTAVERIWHTPDSPGQMLTLTFMFHVKALKTFDVVSWSRGSGRETWTKNQKKPAGTHAPPPCGKFWGLRVRFEAKNYNIEWKVHSGSGDRDTPRGTRATLPSCRVQGLGFRLQGSGFRA